MNLTITIHYLSRASVKDFCVIFSHRTEPGGCQALLTLVMDSNFWQFFHNLLIPLTRCYIYMARVNYNLHRILLVFLPEGLSCC